MPARRLAALALLAAAAQPAAAATYDFSYTTQADVIGPSITASGTITTGTVFNTPDVVTDVTGFRDGLAITYTGFLERIYPQSGYLDGSGITFSAGGVEYNLYRPSPFSAQIFEFDLDANEQRSASIFSFSPAAAVPEPATWAMLIGGFGVAGGALRRRRERLAAA